MKLRLESLAALLAATIGTFGQARAADDQDPAQPRKQEPPQQGEPAPLQKEDAAQLQKQIQELQSSVAALKQRLLAQNDGAVQEPDATPPPGAAASPPATAPAPAAPGPEPASPSLTEDDLNGIRSDLETFKYQYGREREYNTALANRPVNISGTLQTRASYVNHLAPATVGVANNNAKSTFANGAAAIQFSGNLYRDYEAGRNLTYLLRASAATTGGVNLQFASLTYNLFSTLSPENERLTVTVGQQIVPFGLDVAAPDELKPTIIGAQFAALFPNAIDLGALVRGEIGVGYDYGYSYRAPLITYYAGVVNGSGANKTDDNGSKDFFGRLVLTVPAGYNSWLRQLALGASGYKGTQNTTLGNAGMMLSGKGRKDRVGFDVYYNHHPFGVTYEYVRGWDARTFGTTAAAPQAEDVISQGHVVTVYYTFGEQFLYNQSALGTASTSQGRFDDWWPKSYQPFVRFDTFNPSLDGKHGFTKDVYTAGFNVFFAATTKFQINANYIKDHNPASPIPRVYQALGQLQFGF